MFSSRILYLCFCRAWSLGSGVYWAWGLHGLCSGSVSFQGVVLIFHKARLLLLLHMVFPLKASWYSWCVPGILCSPNYSNLLCSLAPDKTSIYFRLLLLVNFGYHYQQNFVMLNIWGRHCRIGPAACSVLGSAQNLTTNGSTFSLFNLLLIFF